MSDGIPMPNELMLTRAALSRSSGEWDDGVDVVVRDAPTGVTIEDIEHFRHYRQKRLSEIPRGRRRRNQLSGYALALCVRRKSN